MTVTIIDLALHCRLWSLLALGGNAAVLSAIQHYTVDVRHWLTGAQFVAFFALSQAARGAKRHGPRPHRSKGRRPAGGSHRLDRNGRAAFHTAYHGGAYLDRHGDVPWVKSIRQGFAPITVGLRPFWKFRSGTNNRYLVAETRPDRHQRHHYFPHQGQSTVAHWPRRRVRPPERNSGTCGFSEAKRPLFEKSGAKTFVYAGPGLCRRQRPWPSINKVFLLLFVHKKKSSSLP